MKNSVSILTITALLLLAVSCKKDDGIAPGNYNRGNLIEAVEKGTISKAEVIERITELDHLWYLITILILFCDLEDK